MTAHQTNNQNDQLTTEGEPEEEKIKFEAQEKEDLPSKKEGKQSPEAYGKEFLELIERIKACQEPEKKLEEVIRFMESTLSQTGTPHFKDFWEAKKCCLDLFKEDIHPSVRVVLWAKYTELCQEVRRLKEIFDEQSAFAVEQFEIAIKALEDDLTNIPSLIEKAPAFQFVANYSALENNFARYSALQQELQFLNAYATRTNALRKELIRTEMRIRDKNKFFQRLSQVGDLIFPKRKALIQEVSELFSHDVEEFIKKTFTHELSMPSLFQVREEIKGLQACAKQLTLHTEAFSKTRLRLSECWDSIKNVIQEKKHVAHEQKEEYKQHLDQFINEIAEIQKNYEAKSLDADGVEEKLKIVQQRMRKAVLGKMEIRALRDEMGKLRYSLQEEAKAQAQERKQIEQQKEQEKLQKFSDLQTRIEALSSQMEQSQADTILQSYKELVQEMRKLQLTRVQKETLDKALRELKDLLSEKKEKELLVLPSDKKQGVGQLLQVLEERKERRQEIKDRIEKLRKARGVSGLDFQAAMKADEELLSEKEKLEKIEAAIDEIEDQIDDLEE